MNTGAAGAWVGAKRMDAKARDRWLDALEPFEVAQRAKGAQPATIARRVKHVRRFALDVGVSPWHVTSEDVLGWLENLEVAASTKASMRDSLRAFYRWGHASGKSKTDPTEAVSYRAQRLAVPTQWEQPLTAYERYLYARGAAPTSVRRYLEAMRSFSREHSSREPFDVTVDDLYEWMSGKRWARETRRGMRAILKSFYGWAVDTGRADSDPTAKLPRVKAGDPVARPATDDEYAAALANADERWTLALRLSAELGLRRAEVAGMHTSDIVEQGGVSWLTVHGKGSKLRRIPLPDALALTLRTVEPGYVFPGRIVDRHARTARAGHMSPRYMGRRIGELLPPGVTMHALRHRFATRAYNVNRDVFTVQKLLGHASPATTQRYVQVADDRMRALVEAVNP